MSITLKTRKRLSPEHSRAAALEAARALLIESGPHAVTLKAVAGRIGRTHANLLHHFGSAAGLQAELARSIAQSVTTSIGDAVERARKRQRPLVLQLTNAAGPFGEPGAALELLRQSAASFSGTIKRLDTHTR